MTTLAALLSSIVGSRSTSLPTLATQVPTGTTPESRVKRFARWVGKDTITEEVYFIPYAEVVLRPLAWQTLVVIMAGSGVGRGCVAFMMPVVSKGRALPLVWQVRQGKQGHCPEDIPMALVEQLSALSPPGTRVVLRGEAAIPGEALNGVHRR